ncbi:hypothetical protein PHJA_002822000 [Phtheirospermum japonicum]|uniref:Uncharacterized protein n=1 Tax=Phtheirospermum japonicum TaxID=374723 RepID=A0A830D679_9LAMI|nr:hypothetical protein PHJA_002822000 [Phtheirospermum japonicum]
MSSGSLSAAAAEDDHHELAVDLNIISSVQDRKDQALLVLKAELMDKLNKEVKSLDDDSWMFDGPRSCIHLISGPGGIRHRCSEISTRRDMAPPK